MSSPPFADEVPELVSPLHTVAAAILAEDGRVVDANRGFLELVDEADHATREDARELFRQPTFEALANDPQADEARVHEGLVHVGDPDAPEAVALRGSVWTRGNRLVVFLERDLEGEHKVRDRVLELNRELSEAQREMNRELEAHKRTEEALERSNELLREFAYVVSHDLQEPLRTVQSYLELLERKHAGDLDEDAREYVDLAVEGAQRMRSMIEGLLAYSRIEVADVEPEPVDAADAVEGALANLQARVEETGASVEVGELATVRADAGQLTHVFQNLVANALDHAGPAPEVEVGVEAVEEGTARFFVADDGPGLPEDEADELFGVFEQGSGVEAEGAGVGLAVCRRAVERHGGRIGVESPGDGGARFWFELPLAGEGNMDENENGGR